MVLKACDAGRAANKWLMVNIQNVQEFSCQVLNRDVWSNSTVKQVVGGHFILWQVRNLPSCVTVMSLYFEENKSSLEVCTHHFLE